MNRAGKEGGREAVSERYELARHHIACVMRGILNALERTPDELMGYAHGLEDAAYVCKGLSNQKRRAEEEAEWSRMMAL